MKRKNTRFGTACLRYLYLDAILVGSATLVSFLVILQVFKDDTDALLAQSLFSVI
jgi:hypothetical protein